MSTGPIVDEARQVREQFLTHYDSNLGKFVDHLLEEQAKDRDRLASKEELLY
jgi:hypothetical protein